MIIIITLANLRAWCLIKTILFISTSYHGWPVKSSKDAVSHLKSICFWVPDSRYFLYNMKTWRLIKLCHPPHSINYCQSTIKSVALTKCMQTWQRSRAPSPPGEFQPAHTATFVINHAITRIYLFIEISCNKPKTQFMVHVISWSHIIFNICY